MTDFQTNGMQIVNRITNICEERRIVRKTISDALGLPDNCFSNWSSRGTVPAGDVCLKIANYLKVSVEWLISGKEGGLSKEESELLAQWNMLSPEQKNNINILLDGWKKARDEEKNNSSQA